MHYKSLRHFLFVFVIFVLSLKFFTAIVTFSDDPYSFFVFKKVPSIINKIVIDSDEAFRNYFVLMSDENKLIGQDTYYLLVDNMFVISLVIIYIVLCVGIRHLTNKD